MNFHAVVKWGIGVLVVIAVLLAIPFAALASDVKRDAVACDVDLDESQVTLKVAEVSSPKPGEDLTFTVVASSTAPEKYIDVYVGYTISALYSTGTDEITRKKATVADELSAVPVILQKDTPTSIAFTWKVPETVATGTYTIEPYLFTATNPAPLQVPTEKGSFKVVGGNVPTVTPLLSRLEKVSKDGVISNVSTILTNSGTVDELVQIDWVVRPAGTGRFGEALATYTQQAAVPHGASTTISLPTLGLIPVESAFIQLIITPEHSPVMYVSDTLSGLQPKSASITTRRVYERSLLGIHFSTIILCVDNPLFASTSDVPKIGVSIDGQTMSYELPKTPRLAIKQWRVTRESLREGDIIFESPQINGITKTTTIPLCSQVESCGGGK